MSTDVTLTIQDGKLTWIEQKGDELNPLDADCTAKKGGG
jgi:hypothetical protein